MDVCGMTDDEDWDFDEEPATYRPKTIKVIVLVIVLIIASVGSFLILRDEDDFPSVAKAPNLQVGMDWWYQREESIINTETGNVESLEIDYSVKSVKAITSYQGKEAYNIQSLDVNRTTTRHSSNHTEYISVQNLNRLDDDGNEYVVFDFPLKDGKQWNWIDNGDNNRTYICKTVKDVKTLDGTYDTYRVRVNWSDEDDDWRFVYRSDYYYSPKLGFMVKRITQYDFYDNGDLSSTIILVDNLVAHGTSDSDGDGLSDNGEKWFGTDPVKKDTDSDGFDDLVDIVPLFDFGISVNLTYVSTEEDVESIAEVTLFGEEEGADFYFELSQANGDDLLETDPIRNSDTSDLDIIYRIDIPDDTDEVNIDIECWDADDGTADDVMDISMDEDVSYLELEFRLFYNWLRLPHVPYPEGVLELDVEQEVYGNGNGDYDATLRFIGSVVDMEIYN